MATGGSQRGKTASPRMMSEVVEEEVEPSEPARHSRREAPPLLGVALLGVASSRLGATFLPLRLRELEAAAAAGTRAASPRAAAAGARVR